MWAEQLRSITDDNGCPALHDPQSWLSAAEQERLKQIRSSCRKTAWLAGRRLAKELLYRLDGRTSVSLSAWHVESCDGRERPTQPRAFRCGRLVPWAISISHSNRSVYVAISTEENVRLGVDVTSVQPLSDSFARLWLTDNERQWCARDETGLLRCLVWSVKESCYKALGSGRPFRPRQVDCMTATSLGQLPTNGLFDRAGLRQIDDERSTLVCRIVDSEVASAVVLRPRFGSRQEVTPQSTPRKTARKLAYGY